ncbi:MFS transporter [Halobacillus sp. Marseille-P3879]|uniref:MFS transporter n=1 Tax=Halobacillus sp. Marseille-P3879 TaxID=2045014 RepID=UPI000C7C24BD|nr:MFS transporter [Halobacillus sp. Marseille-P3879]
MKSRAKLWTWDFINVWISNFFVFLVFYLLFVTMPVYIMEDIEAGQGAAGLVITVFLLAAILIRPLTGHWVETVGRMPVLLIALSIFGISSILYVTTDSLIAILLIRFLHGVGFGMGTTVLGALAADVVPSQRKGEGMGYFAMSMNFAMVIGPFLGLTLIQSFSYSIMFISCIAAAAIAFLTGVTIKAPQAKPLSKGERESIIPKLDGLFEKSVIPIAVTGAIVALAYAGVLSFVSVYAKDLGLEEASSYFFVVYAVVLLVSRPFTGRWFDRYGENVIVIPSIITFGIGLIVLSLAENSLMLLIAGGLIGLGWGTMVPSMQTIALQKVPERAGSATATFFTIFDTGVGFGSYVVGVAASGIGLSSLYFQSSFFVFAAVFLYVWLHGRKTKADPHSQMEYSS